MSDEFNRQAERLLPWEVFSCETADEATWQRLAEGIAAALRWQAEVAESNKRLYLAASADAAKHKAEVERLKADRDMWLADSAKQNSALGFARAEIADLRAKLEEAVFHLRTYEEADGYHGGYGPHHLSRKIKDLEAKLAEAEAEVERMRTIDRLEKILNSEDDRPVTINPDGTVTEGTPYKLQVEQLRAKLAEQETGTRPQEMIATRDQLLEQIADLRAKLAEREAEIHAIWFSGIHADFFDSPEGASLKTVAMIAHEENLRIRAKLAEREAELEQLALRLRQEEERSFFLRCQEIEAKLAETEDKNSFLTGCVELQSALMEKQTKALAEAEETIAELDEHATIVHGQLAEAERELEQQRAMCWTLWESLTPEKRHELNLAAPQFPIDKAEGK